MRILNYDVYASMETQVTESSSTFLTGTQTGNYLSGDYTLNESSNGTYTMTETNGITAGGGGIGGLGSLDLAANVTTTGTTTGTVTWSPGQFSLNEYGSLTTSLSETGNQTTGLYTRTETAQDTYSMTETGGNTGGSFTETVTGTDSPTLVETGNSVNQWYSRTVSGTDSYSRTDGGPGATLSSGSGTITYTLAETSDARAGILSQTESGTDRYGLLERYVNVANTSSPNEPGMMDYYSFGQPFFDDGPLTKEQQADYDDYVRGVLPRPDDGRHIPNVPRVLSPQEWLSRENTRRNMKSPAAQPGPPPIAKQRGQQFPQLKASPDEIAKAKEDAKDTRVILQICVLVPGPFGWVAGGMLVGLDISEEDYLAAGLDSVPFVTVAGKAIIRGLPRGRIPNPALGTGGTGQAMHMVAPTSGAIGEALEERSVRITTAQGAGAVRPDRHHIFPEAQRTWFSDRGITIDQWTVELDSGTHQALHYGGGPGRGGGWWNDTIMRSLIERENALQRRLTAQEIEQIGRQMMQRAGIGNLPIVPYRGG